MPVNCSTTKFRDIIENTIITILSLKPLLFKVLLLTYGYIIHLYSVEMDIVWGKIEV